MSHTRFLPGLAVACLVLSATAQTTHLVGPGGFPQIDAALAVAAPGDVVLVQPGSYWPFHLSSGVTIRGTAAAGVSVQTSSTVAVPPGQVAHLVDLALVQLVVSGECTLDRCSIGAAEAVGAAVAATSARLRLQNCWLGTTSVAFTATHALEASNSSISATDTSFRGAQAHHVLGLAAGTGIRLQACTLQASGIDVMGGAGFPTTPYPPAPAITANASTVWISDSVITGGPAPVSHAAIPYACPVLATAGRLVRCAVLPASCPPSIPTTGPLLGARRQAPLQSGGSFTLHWPTDPNGLVVVFASAGLGDTMIPGVEQPSLLQHATMWPLAVLVADATGIASSSWTLPPGVANLSAWFQGVAFAPGGFVASPVVGGIVR